jgi:hypothetical protein
MRTAGSSALFNTDFWVDRTSRVTAAIYSLLPFSQPQALRRLE